MSQNIKANWVELPQNLRAFYAHPGDDGKYPAVVIYIEAFGVNTHFEALAQRYARSGFRAIVPDIYHGQVFDYSDLDNALGAIKALDESQVMAETNVAIDFLESKGIQGKPAVVGYCLGGRLAFRANCDNAERIGAAVGYYGGSIAPADGTDRFGRKSLLDHIDAMQAPIFLHYGAEDTSIPPEEHGRITEALSKAKKRYQISVYPNAGHGFFCDQRQSYHEASANESWSLTMAFLNRYAS